MPAGDWDIETLLFDEAADDIRSSSFFAAFSPFFFMKEVASSSRSPATEIERLTISEKFLEQELAKGVKGIAIFILWAPLANKYFENLRLFPLIHYRPLHAVGTRFCSHTDSAYKSQAGVKFLCLF